MTTLEPAFTVHEVSMQEWAMAAFHAARAPQRVRVTVKTVTPPVYGEDPLPGPAHLWLIVGSVAAVMVWFLI